MYYLKDLALLGCHFIPEAIQHNFMGNTLISGTLFLSGKRYPAQAVHFRNGRPAKLYDISGASPEEAEGNLQRVTDYVEYCILHDVNGIHKVIRQRFFLSLVRNMTTFLSCFMLGYTFYQCLIGSFAADLMVFFIIMLALWILCQFVNSKTRQF